MNETKVEKCGENETICEKNHTDRVSIVNIHENHDKESNNSSHVDIHFKLPHSAKNAELTKIQQEVEDQM